MTALLGAAYHSGESLPAPVKSIGIYRFFFPPGKMASAQTFKGQANLVKAHDQYGARVFSISFKPDGTDAKPFATPDNINKFVDSIPADVDRKNILLTYYHEHDGNLKDGSLNLTNYKNGSKQVADVAHANGCKYGPIHNGNVYDPNKKPHWGLYESIWSKNEADLSLYDFWGVDCYSPNYEDPAPRMDALRAYADKLGKPLLVAEMGAPIDDPAKQKAWAAKARTWALAKADWASYWSSQVSPTDTNYRLTDDSAKAWFGLT